MSSVWKSVKLSEVCTKISDGTHHSPDVQHNEPGKGRFKYVTSKNIRPWGLDLGDIAYVDEKVHREIYSRCQPEMGDVLLTKDGANTGNVAINTLDEEFSLLSSVALLKPKRDVVESRFLRYYIESPVGSKRLLGEMTGTAIRRIILKKIKDTEIPVAPLAEQRRIVAEIEKQFTRLEAGVAALRRVQANLKRYRAAVLKAACEGRLVPIEAELHRKLKTKNSKLETGAQLLARILTERRQNWQGRGQYKEPAAPDTGKLASLLDGWTQATVEQLTSLVATGATPLRGKSDFWNAGNIPWVTSGALNDDFVTEAFEFITPLAIQKTNAKLFPAGTLLVALYGEGKTRGKVSELKIEAATNQACAALLFGSANSAIRPYLKVFLQNNYEAVRLLASGGVQPNLSLSIMKNTVVPLPPLAEQTRIVAEVERRLSVVAELESVVTANLQRATRLRQSILQKAFSGELVATMPAIQISDIIPPLKPEHINRPNSHFARAVLSAEIVHRLHIEPTFGRIKHQKIFHLCEHIAQIEEIKGQYHREAAGPLDNKLIYANEAELKKQKWYQEVRRESYGHAYQALAKAGGHRKYVERYWADKLPLVEKLIELMRKWDTERCEIFCTAYAAWNDLILWGKQATEDNILHEILERWHDSKKRFPKERWLKAIGWMKKEGFVPTGFGKPTKEAK